MAHIVVLATGGTIASRFSQDHGAVIAEVRGEELVRAIHGLAPSVEVVAEQF